ncbi:hypothetical protein [Halovenus halobia]|uniref:hypothetical protein n=1 Tax=Halovenus halobia TaxID=3396622 RepID=UPI003F561344
MSSESRTETDSGVGEQCTACGAGLSEQVLALQTYPESDEQTLDGLTGGGLTHCPECAAEPVALLDTWTDHDQPPVDPDQPLGAGYREVSDNCSFCGNDCDQPVVGVELYRRPGGGLPAYANYTLCGDCQDVFEEFLANIRE